MDDATLILGGSSRGPGEGGASVFVLWRSDTLSGSEQDPAHTQGLALKKTPTSFGDIIINIDLGHK